MVVLWVVFPTVIFSQVNDYIKRDDSGQRVLTEKGASHFAKLALDCMQKEYPNKLSQVLKTEDDIKIPKVLHPAFYECFDWHSSVHGHWMLVRLLKLFPNMPEAEVIKRKLNENINAENIAGEVTYFKSASASFERMYGWSWLQLAEELYTWNDRDAKRLYENLLPLTQIVVERYEHFLPKQFYPVRTGVHPNTAFGLSFAWDFAITIKHETLASLIRDRAEMYYLNDEDCPCDWEPSGEDFLSACLEEANIMSRILDKGPFQKWWRKFLPQKRLNSLRIPVDISDRSDPKIVHLDGLNLARAWSFYTINEKIVSKRQIEKMKDAANKHLEATLPFVANTHYEGGHSLGSFAVYALSMGTAN